MGLLFFFFPNPFPSIRSLGFCLNVALGALSFLCCRSCCRHTLPHLRLRNSGSVLRPRASPSHAGSQEGLSRFLESLLCGGTELSAHTAQTIHCVLFNTPPRCVPAARLVPGRAAAGTELCWEATRHYLFHPNEKKSQAPTAPALTHTSEQPMRR